MSLENIQNIWDSQSLNSLYTLDQKELSQRVKKRARLINLQLNLFEYWFGFLAFVVAFLTVQDDLMRGDRSNPVTYLTGALFLSVAILIFARRAQRLNREKQFNESTRSSIQKSVTQLGHQIWVLKATTGFPMIILILGMGMQLFRNPDGRPLWLYVVASMIIPILLSGIYFVCSKRILPAKLKLESLLKELSEEGEE